MLNRLKSFFRRETVFCVSAVLAVLSMLLVPPDSGYLGYPDYRTLALLFCLMSIVAGFRSLGVFERMGRSLIRRASSLRSLSGVLVLLCFFCSMVITNDVTLLTFVPFTLLVFQMIGQEDRVMFVVILETLAANLGSMATPIGNPQNLYLFSAAQMTAGQFARAVLPYAAVSLALLLAALLLQPAVPVQDTAPEDSPPAALSWRKLLPYLALLVLCLLVVFRLLPYGAALAAVLLVILVMDRRLFRSVDYVLLLTFLCFFVFIGNLKRIPEVNSLLRALVEGHELWAGILGSQVISNVPAAILLSGFTEDFAALLTAVNLGGLGTLIASLASLISYKFFAAAYPRRKGRYFWRFTLWNLLFLAILIGEALLLIM